MYMKPRLPAIKPIIAAANETKSINPPASPSKPSMRLMEFEIPINQKTKIIINANWDNGNVLLKNITVSMWGKN